MLNGCRKDEEREDEFGNAISQSTRDYRNRRQRISVQINMLGWLLESAGLWLLCPVYLISGGNNIYTSMMMAPFYCFFQLILVPYTLLLNESRIKKLILRSGWLIALRSVFRFKQNAVEPQPVENLEMGVLSRNIINRNAQNSLRVAPRDKGGGRTNRIDAISQSSIESASETIISRRQNDISWPQNYCGRQTTFPKAMRHNKRLDKVCNNSAPTGNCMKIIEEENETDTDEEFVETTENPCSQIKAASSSNKQLNELDSTHTTENVRKVARTQENKKINISSPSFLRGRKSSHSIRHSDTFSFSSDLKVENSGWFELLYAEFENRLERAAGVTSVAEAEGVSSENTPVTSVCLSNDFKTFSRKELINKMIDLHLSSEIKYLQTFQRLVTLENELYRTDTVCYDNDVFMALFNKWMVSRKKNVNWKDAKEEQNRTSIEHQLSTTTHPSKEFRTDEKDIQRHYVLHKMISNVRDQSQYLKLLKHLYFIERGDLTTFDDCAFLNNVS